MILFFIGWLLSPFHQMIMPLPGSTTPMIELSKHHKVTRGFVCFNLNEVRCIDDVCGDETHYWRVKVNGNSYSFNANSPVSQSDRVEWEYVSSKGR